MKKSKPHLIILVATLVFGLLPIFNGTCLSNIMVKDSLGTSLDFGSPPKNVVCLVPSATEIIFKLGVQDSISGVTYHDATLKGAETKTVMGGFFMPSLKDILALKPDLIIISPFQKKIKNTLKAQGYPLFAYETKSIIQSHENILALGKIFNREIQAQDLISKIQKEIRHIDKKLQKAVPLKNRKRVIRLMGRDKIMTPGNTSFQNELIALAGGIPPDFGRPGSVVDVTLKEWTSFNPQVIYGCGMDREAAAAFFSKPGWKDVDAVKNNQIFYFPCELTCRASTHTGYFISWLASMIYTPEFADPANDLLSEKIIDSRPISLDLDHVKSAEITYSNIFDFVNKTLVIDFKTPQTMVSTLEGQRDNILTVGNHYSPPPTWGPGHKRGIDQIKTGILNANKKERETSSFLITGADMDNLSISKQSFKEMKVTALVTAGVLSNAMRMSKDTGMFYEPGTINVIILTNMKLSPRAMTRAIISATEAKTAVLEDMDIRSAYTPLIHGATGTGTDNILMVQGQGLPIKNAGGHSKMGELIAKAVYAGVNEAVLKQNKISANRHIFQRLKERHLSVLGVIDSLNCGCLHENNIDQQDMAKVVEHLLLEKKYAGFLESALALSDAYDRGLIKDLTFFEQACLSIASQIAGNQVDLIENMVGTKEMPRVLAMAFNTILTGAMERGDNALAALPTIPQRVISLSPIITETIFMVGAQDKLIGNTLYCNTPVQAQTKEKVGTVTQMNVEKIMSMGPDLVIASTLSKEKQLRLLENQSINVFRSQNPKTFEDICQMTLDIGNRLGHGPKAATIVEKARIQAQQIFEKTVGLEKPRIFIQIGLKPLHSANKEMFINEYIRYSGGMNIAENESGGIYSREKVIQENPDIILIATMGTSKKAGELEKKRWMSFPSLKAVQGNRVHVLDPELICSPTPTTFIKGLETILPLVHPGIMATMSENQ